MKAGQNGRFSDREFAFLLNNLVSTLNLDWLFSRVFRHQ